METNSENSSKRKRFECVQKTARLLRNFVAPHYEKLTQEQRETVLKMFDTLDAKYNQFVEGEEAWDSRIIKRVGDVQGVKFRTNEISTFDSVMDYVRGIMGFVVSPETAAV